MVAVFEDDTWSWLPRWHFLGLPLKDTESFVSGSASEDPNLREPSLFLTLLLYFASVQSQLWKACVFIYKMILACDASSKVESLP